MTTDTPRTDALPSTQPMLTAQSDPVKLYQQLCKVTVDFGKALDACVEYRNQLAASKAEVKMLNNILENTRESRDTMIEDRNLLDRELAASKAEVERLRGLLEEAIPTLRRFHYANLSIHLRQCLNNIDSEKQPSTPTRNDHENNVQP